MQHYFAKLLLISYALSLGLLSTVALADYSKDFNKCMESSGGVAADMLDCIGKEVAIQDKLLNEYYKQLIAQNDKPQAQSLKEAQRAWLKYREADSFFVNDGGSLGAVNEASRFLEITALRVSDLARMLGINSSMTSTMGSTGDFSMFTGTYELQDKFANGIAKLSQAQDGTVHLDLNSATNTGFTCEFSGVCSLDGNKLNCYPTDVYGDIVPLILSVSGFTIEEPHPDYCGLNGYFHGFYVKK